MRCKIPFAVLRRPPVGTILLAALLACQPVASRRGGHGAVRVGRRPPEHEPAASRSIRSPARSSATSCSRRSPATTRRSCRGPTWRARWSWSPDRRALTFHLVAGRAAGTTACPRPSRDVRWTLDAARDPAVGYPRADRARRSRAGRRARRLDRDPPLHGAARALSRRAHRSRDPPGATCSTPCRATGCGRRRGTRRPVGNGPFRFVAHEPNRRWVFAANPDFPAALGGPPAARAPHRRRGGRARHQARRAHRGRARLRRHPAGPRDVRARAIPRSPC